MNPLRNETDFEQALSSDRVFLFKHSTRCGTSTRAFRQVSSYEDIDGSIPVYVIDVISERALAHYIADRLGIRHQSPQVILLVGGQPIWHASHGAVTSENLAEKAGAP
jgi:bacillithiol system protein YtxJ